MLKILLAEKQTLFRQTLKSQLETDTGIQVVAEASDSKEVISKLQLCEIDSLVLNISLPGISGPDLITRAKAVNPKLTILAFCMNYESQLITQALKNGAGGCISTMHDIGDFLVALRKVARGSRYIDPVIAESMMLENISGEDEPIYSRLSQREQDIFRLLVSGNTINQIADQLIISNKTVSSHKKKIMEKMHFAGIADLMRYAVQRRLFDDRSNTPVC